MFLPPPLGDYLSIFSDTPWATGAKLLLLSKLCRRYGTSLASSYSSSLKSSISLPFFCGEHLAFVTFPFHFTFISAIKPFGIASFPFLLRILPPAVGIYFLQLSYKPCCSETRCPSSNTEFSTSTVHKSLFRPLEPDNLNLYRRSRHFTCPLFLSHFDAVKPYLPFLRFFVSSLAVDGFAPGLLWLFRNSPAVKASILALPFLVSYSSID